MKIPKVMTIITFAEIIIRLCLHIAISWCKRFSLGILVITIFVAVDIIDKLFYPKEKHNSANGAFSF
ncbi:hypothetical protein KAR26_03445 [Candidatus Parcubacteria bacterium]|nr:hypothetical protein [Candidatus Parcubacteria bacterium]